ncbi:RluA family pseudouridine synthase [candidate division KSB1 bacterium]|nr:RluA family pseudouridine synthase [candidate division KSB1 bacterium]
METNTSTFSILVTEEQVKQRIDKFLADVLSQFTRARIQKLIEDDRVLVDGKPVKASHLVRANERIEVNVPEPVSSHIQPQPIPLDIVYEDDYLLVINKKAGMVVHPAYGNVSNTMVNALLHHCVNLSGIGGVKRPGIVHRLDKDTSGLLVVAKDDETHLRLSQQFSSRTIEREYTAVVWGNFRLKSGKITSYIARSRRDRTRMVVSESRGKLAITRFKVMEEFPLTSLLAVKLETGRTHQIRVHLAAKGHPVFGDLQYGGRKKMIMKLNQGKLQIALNLLSCIARQALHARTLGFVHPHTNEYLKFTSELPGDMSELIAEMQKAKSDSQSL